MTNVFIIQKFYGSKYGWDNLREDGMLFDTKQEALECFFEDDMIEETIPQNANLESLPLPEDVRIVEMRF
jgi:hypothetical protein